MALGPLDFLPGVITTPVLSDGVGPAQGLRIDDPGTGFGPPLRALGLLGLLAQLLAQGVVDEIERPVVAPVDEVPIDGPPMREVVGHHAPGAPGAGQVQDGVDDLALRIQRGPSARRDRFRLGQQGLHHRPLAIGQIGRIPTALHHAYQCSALARKSRAPREPKRAGHARN